MKCNYIAVEGFANTNIFMLCAHGRVSQSKQSGRNRLSRIVKVRYSILYQELSLCSE